MIKIQWDKKTVIMVAGIAAAVIAFVLMAAPLFKEVRSAGVEVKALEQEMASVRQAIQSKDKFQEKGDLLTSQKLSLAIGEISRTGTVRNINFLSISPQKATKAQGSKYPVLPIHMVLQSEYKDLGLFLRALEGLKQSIVTVRSFEIRSGGQIPSQIRTDLVVEVYLQEGEDG
ncbi:MAG: type 4a pilus biogenesis protein PilO [Candidatus Omnitrophica bacterium]|nr:type 4a pilus biogenesis protein PilO [Candidatus Omnitrophota bacterium]